MKKKRRGVFLVEYAATLAATILASMAAASYLFPKVSDFVHQSLSALNL